MTELEKMRADMNMIGQMTTWQTANVIALRGIVTLLLSQEKITEEALFETIQPLLNPNSTPAEADNFNNIIKSITTDIISIAQMRSKTKD